MDVSVILFNFPFLLTERNYHFYSAAFTCNNNQPWAVNNDLSYGFAAARLANKNEADLCCKCFKWTFTSGPVTGKSMIIQVTNTGDDLNQTVSGRFIKNLNFSQ